MAFARQAEYVEINPSPSLSEADQPPGHQPAKGSPEGGVAYTILIVDDNAAIRSLLRSLIEPRPEYEVCGEAENGEVAVHKVQELNPDVVILDLQMPVMDGLAAARHIAAASPQTAMVMLTMHATEQLYRLALAAGVKAVLSKTESVEQHLLAALRNICPETRNPTAPLNQ
jgi:DNA-binding NarL/FixJ family response regulator